MKPGITPPNSNSSSSFPPQSTAVEVNGTSLSTKLDIGLPCGHSHAVQQNHDGVLQISEGEVSNHDMVDNKYREEKTVPISCEAIRAAQESADELIGMCLGKFRIDEVIGYGGMGVILKAFDQELDREVAVKQLLKIHQENPKLRRQFTNEARITGRLQHPGIIPIYETGTSSTGRPFFAMKLVKGQTLAELLAARSTPDEDLPRFLKIFEQVCFTVSYTHSQNIIHLDIKPTNIMVGAFGEVHLMDWGLARTSTDLCDSEATPSGTAGADSAKSATSPNASSFRATGSIWGTPAYMSPEQARGQCTDVRSDVYGLGGILCEILTGDPPHEGGSLIDVCYKAAMGDSSFADSNLAKCHADGTLIRLAKQCLNANPNTRPVNATIVARVLTLHLESLFKLAAKDLERFFDLSLDLFGIAGFDGYFRRVNSNFSKVLGHSEKDLVSRPFLDYVHPGDRDSTVAVMGQLSKGLPVVRFQNRYLAADGSWKLFEWMAKSVPEDGIIFAVAREINSPDGTAVLPSNSCSGP